MSKIFALLLPLAFVAAPLLLIGLAALVWLHVALAVRELRGVYGLPWVEAIRWRLGRVRGALAGMRRGNHGDPPMPRPAAPRPPWQETVLK